MHFLNDSFDFINSSTKKSYLDNDLYAFIFCIFTAIYRETAVCIGTISEI